MARALHYRPKLRGGAILAAAEITFPRRQKQDVVVTRRGALK
jgi:hypothetical protein